MFEKTEQLLDNETKSKDYTLVIGDVRLVSQPFNYFENLKKTHML